MSNVMDDWNGTTEQKAAERAWVALRRAFLEEELRHVVTNDGTRLTYVDGRTIQARLDECVGPQRWKATVTPAPHGLIVRLSIRPEKDGPWFDREDVADYGDPDFGRMESAFTKAFRRAAAQFGIARQCYLDNSMSKAEARAPAPRQQPQQRATPARVTGGAPWNEDRVYEVQGNIPHRAFSFNEKWANYNHAQPGNQRFGWDQYSGFSRSANGSYVLKDMTYSLMADRAIPGDELCGYLVWELENCPFNPRYHTKYCQGDRERLMAAKRRHEYRVSQIKGVLLYIYGKAAGVLVADGDADEVPFELEEEIAASYANDDDLPF